MTAPKRYSIQCLGAVGADASLVSKQWGGMMCSICNREGHTASSCPYRPRWRDTAISLFVVILFICGWAMQARGHSWYPAECCGDQDCAPVDAVTFVASDAAKLPIMVVSTKWGTKAVDERTKRYESKDGRLHACIYQGRVLCLFLPPGV